MNRRMVPPTDSHRPNRLSRLLCSGSPCPVAKTSVEYLAETAGGNAQNAAREGALLQYLALRVQARATQ